MKICKECKNEFSTSLKLNGKIRNLGNRSRCLDCSPFGSHNTTKIGTKTRPAKIDKLSNQEFIEIVKNSISRSEIFFKLNLRKSSSAFDILNRRINKDKVDISHFIKGGRNGCNRKYSNKEIFTNNPLKNNNLVRRRILKDGLIQYKCSICEISEWIGKKISLELDHINGNRADNRLENLRFLCPNCHSQTNTFGSKNTGKQHESRAVGLHPKG